MVLPVPSRANGSHPHGPLRPRVAERFHDVQFLVRPVMEVLVKTMSYSESRARYAEVLDSVVNDREEVVITRAGREPVVMVSLEDYESLKETAYLLRSPENARRLLASIERLESGQGLPRDLAE
jgi:antitoxin YefM